MARKKPHEEHENHERWLVSYADFITLLFAFFTVLYALSQTEKNKYDKAIENIQRAFMSAGGVFPLKGNPFTPFNKPADKGSALPPGPSDQGPFSKSSDEHLDTMRKQVRGLFERTTGLGLHPTDIEVLETEEGWKIRLGEFVLFKPGSDKLRRKAIPFIYEVGTRLAKMNLPIQIEGHSDNFPGIDPSENWRLSINRALTVVTFLVEGTKFPKDKIALAGFADSRPIASNETAAGRARNRRVEIAIIAPNREMVELLTAQ